MAIAGEAATSVATVAKADVAVACADADLEWNGTSRLEQSHLGPERTRFFGKDEILERTGPACNNTSLEERCGCT